jgi:hypothetical protein
MQGTAGNGVRRIAMAFAAILVSSPLSAPPAAARELKETTGAAVRRLWRAKAAALAPAAADIVVDGDLADWAALPCWTQGRERDEGFVSPVKTLAIAPAEECLKVALRIPEPPLAIRRDGFVVLVDAFAFPRTAFDLRLRVRDGGVAWDRNDGRWRDAPPSLVRMAKGPAGAWELSLDWSLWLHPAGGKLAVFMTDLVEGRGWVRVAIEGDKAGGPRWASWASPLLVPEPSAPGALSLVISPAEPTEWALCSRRPERSRILDGEDDPAPGIKDDPLPVEHEFVRTTVPGIFEAAPGAKAPPAPDARDTRVRVSFDTEGLFVSVHGLDESRRMPRLHFSWDRGLEGWHSACWSIDEGGTLIADGAPPGSAKVAALHTTRVPTARGRIWEARVPTAVLAEIVFVADGGVLTKGFLHLGTNRIHMLTQRTSEFGRLALVAPGITDKGTLSWKTAAAWEGAPPVRGTWRVIQGPLAPATHGSSLAWDFGIADSRDCHTPEGSGGGVAASYDFGAPLYAPALGVVLKARDSARDAPTALSNELRIGTPDGALVRMGHLRQGSIVVPGFGWFVAAGERVAAVGSSGAAGSHLHFEAWRGDSPCPVVFLGVEVGLNAGADDPWRVPVPRWEPEEGLFFRYDAPAAPGATVNKEE